MLTGVGVWYVLTCQSLSLCWPVEREGGGGHMCVCVCGGVWAARNTLCPEHKERYKECVWGWGGGWGGEQGLDYSYIYMRGQLVSPVERLSRQMLRWKNP